MLGKALLLLTFLVRPAAAGDEPVLVAVAANMMPAMEEIRTAYKEEAGRDLALTPGASGKFAAQIVNGASFSVFISADTEFPEKLAAKGLADGPPARYARGTLILWTLKGLDCSKGLALLESSAVVKAAVANPDAAPYGRAAVAALKKSGLFTKLESKLVYGESLAQVNQFITSKAADAGLAARSIVETQEWKGKGCWSAVDPKLYAPIDQSLVVLKAGEAPAGRRLAKFILGPKGRAILKKYGYLLP